MAGRRSIVVLGGLMAGGLGGLAVPTATLTASSTCLARPSGGAVAALLECALAWLPSRRRDMRRGREIGAQP